MKKLILFTLASLLSFNFLFGNSLKWDTVHTEFDYYDFRLTDIGSKNLETKDFIYTYNLGTRILGNLIATEISVIKKDLTEQHKFQLDSEDNSDELLPFDCKITNDNNIYVVTENGMLFKRNIYENEWEKSKIIDDSHAITRIAFRDMNYALVSNVIDPNIGQVELYYTSNAGETWDLLENQILEFDEILITDINFFGDTLFVTFLDFKTNKHHIYTSFNSGLTWEHKNTIPYDNRDFGMTWFYQQSELWVSSPANNSTIFTHDYGKTWIEVLETENKVTFEAWSIAFTSNLKFGFAAYPFGVYYTTDGINWEFNRHHNTESLLNLDLMVYNYKDEIYLIQDSVALKWDKIGTSILENTIGNLEELIPSPNPATDEIEINLNTSDVLKTSDVSEIEIFNMLGIKVITSQLQSSNKVNVSQLPTGMYIIKIGDRVTKFIKE